MVIKSQKNPPIFIIPYIVFIFSLIIYPIGITFILSMTKEKSFVFMSNFKTVFTDEFFPRVFFNTIVWTTSCVIAIVLLNVGLAILLNQDFKGRNIFRLIILVLPWATPDIVAAVQWKWMYNAMYGVINDLLMRIGFISSPIAWLGGKNLALFSVIVANIWKGYPVGTMILLAALQTIPVEIYEAAQIDGSRGLNTLFRITLPSVAPTFKSIILISAIWTINYFPLIYIMTGGGPAHGTDTLVTWSYRESFSFLLFNKGSAGIVLIFVITLILAVFYIKILTRISES